MREPFHDIMVRMPIRRRFWALLALCFTGLALLGASALAQGQGVAYLFELDDSISPATESWVGKALEEAEQAGAEVAILELDTAGGLDSSTREIVQKITAAPMPVIVYVTPDGARAASAGAFITQAADIAAMAPGTNIGSASPISIGPGEQDEVLGRKITNDAAAYMRALAETHGRDPELGERMVTEAVNVTAEEALDAGFIDLVAATPEELLAAADGFVISGPKAQTLSTTGLELQRHEMPFSYRALGVLVSPTMAFLLLTVGLIGIAIEIFSPGLIVPGAFGTIALVLGLYGTAQLPVTWVGIFLLLVAIALLIAEAHLPTGGLLGVPGVVALALAGLLLFNSDEGADVSTPAVITTAVVLGGFFAFLVQKIAATRRKPVKTGWEELIGQEAEVRSRIAPEGQIFVMGALWRAVSSRPDEVFNVGDRVRIDSVDGLTLSVSGLGTQENGDEGAK